ncbi:putative addiction module toxin, Txe/YoeB [Cellvibrio sp. BR]|uniref:Txe/YoeB family addiction module toxin n=1 Tax=unclassified Cellvibrio TaxID=2624793 RepID=UPI0002600EF7|nr:MULTISPECIES: Txe/YoeB family addiction module toxin [unclassified Cellvibrio]EIK45622.1 putative addiction module toxin, Txe/YoeB [Cellvibrio sp. BR]UUA74043.1 Txe/YoeB family addiction module toxin [Cellvibrio sp. QJXJ]
MILAWADNAWEDYLYWQQTDQKTLKRINTLIKEIQRQPFIGIGDPEPLKHHWSGYWSRRIDREHRLVYRVENEMIIVVQCRYHY